MCCGIVSNLEGDIQSRGWTYQVTVSVEVSTLVMLMVTCDSTGVCTRGVSVI
jgi:hypothetical protein